MGRIALLWLVATAAWAQANCTYTLSAVSAGAPFEGGTGEVRVGADPRCFWVSVSNVPWIQATGPMTLQSGGGIATYQVAANSAPEPRSGTLTIAGHKFTVVQNALGVTLSLTAVTNAASYAQFGVAPGEFVVLWGSGIGPATLVPTEYTEDRKYMTNTLAATRVLFDGIPSPMVYAYKYQTCAIVPYGLALKSSTGVRVEYEGNSTNTLTLEVRPTLPGVFTIDSSGVGQAAVLNQDYSVNGPLNPAARGSVIMIYATGDGQTDPPGIDGLLAVLPLPQTRAQVSVRIGGKDAKIHYTGGALGLVAGVVQINAEIPLDAPVGDALPLILQVGEMNTSARVTIAVRP